MRDGAFDYVVKPFDNDELRACVARALDLSRRERENRYLRQAFDNRGRDAYTAAMATTRKKPKRKRKSVRWRAALKHKARRKQQRKSGHKRVKGAGRKTGG